MGEDGNAKLKDALSEAAKFHKEAMKPIKSKKAFVNWWANIYKPDQTQIPQDRYSEMSSGWHKWFKFIGSSGGYHRDTNQQMFRIACDQRKSLKDHIKEVEFVIPYIKEHEGSKYLSVFEHTLSEGGSYSIKIKGSKATFEVMRWHNPSIIKKGTIEEIIEYVRENHPYHHLGLKNDW